MRRPHRDLFAYQPRRVDLSCRVPSSSLELLVDLEDRDFSRPDILKLGSIFARAHLITSQPQAPCFFFFFCRQNGMTLRAKYKREETLVVLPYIIFDLSYTKESEKQIKAG